LIVRNEEPFLEGCLASLSGRVDEIVVVDTGSTDRSRQIALDFGARLYDYAWHDDFAAARNHSIDQALGDWILYIDADERIVDYDAAGMSSLLADPRHICYTVRFRPASGFTRYREYRLFRKRPDLRFRGSVHESLIPDIETLTAQGWRLGDSPMALDHHGYDGDMKRKHARNLPLLRARLERDPMHVYSWDQLGLTLFGLDDPNGAESTWRHAIDIVRALPIRSESDSAPYLHLADHWLNTQRDAAKLLDEALGLFPDNHALSWLRAKQYAESGDYAAALPLFARLADIDPRHIETSRVAYDTSIFGAQAHAALGHCAFQLGRFAESAEHYARAEALEAGNIEFRAKRAVAAAKARQAAQAPR
jgi:tetratricopeptide (TPR) repeat protein